jgi:ABC-type glycerol-3-phosphate transport system permease component
VLSGELAVGAVIVIVVFLAVMLVIASLSAALLKVGARIIDGETLAFSSALWTIIIAMLANLVIGGLVSAALGSDLIGAVISIGVSLCIYAAVISKRHDISFGKSVLISLFITVVSAVIAVAVALAIDTSGFTNAP